MQKFTDVGTETDKAFLYEMDNSGAACNIRNACESCIERVGQNTAR